MPKNNVAKSNEGSASIEIELNAELFTNADYEIMENFSSGNSEKHTTKEIFDILDRVVVGGFRDRPFIHIRPTIKAILDKLQNEAMGENSKN